MNRLIPILLPTIAAASPMDEMEWLKHEPASLLDVGLLRFEISLVQDGDRYADLYREAADLIDSPRIVSKVEHAEPSSLVLVRLNVTTDNATREGATAGCHAVMEAVEEHAENNFEDYFAHRGYRAFNQPTATEFAVLGRLSVFCEVGSADDPDQFGVVQFYPNEPFAAKENKDDE